MPPDPALVEFEAERDRLALLTRKGIGMPMAGMLYWLAVAFMLRALPQKTALVFSFAPEWAPFALAVLFGSHFLPYTWLYRSAGYGFLAVATTLVVSAGVIVTQSPLYATVPLLAAACYAVAVAMLWREVGALAPKQGGA